MAYQKLAQALNDSVQMYTPDVLYPRECLIINVNEDQTLKIKINIGDNVYLDNVKYIGIPKVGAIGLFVPLNNNYNEGYCICYIENEEYLTENVIINNYGEFGETKVNEVNIDVEEIFNEEEQNISDETQTIINYDKRYAKINHTHEDTIGTIDELKTLIKNTKEGNILSLDKNFKNERYGNIIINKKITIDGNGHSIENISFTCDTDEIELNNIVFFNVTTNRVNGGALQLNGQRISINNCIFYNNIINGTSVYEGGAISVNNSSVETKIVDCYFISNFCSNNGGAIRWIANDGILIGCKFIGNTATNTGGAIKWLGTNGLIRDCLFENNESNNAKDILTTDENLMGIGNKFLTESDIIGSEKFYDYITEFDKKEIENEIHSSFGRNILYNTQEMIVSTPPNNISYTEEFRKNKVVYFDNESSNENNYRDWYYDIPTDEFDYDDEFTFSFWAKSDKENIGKIKAYFTGGTDYIKTKVINSNGYDYLNIFNDGHITFDVKDKWKKCFVTWKLNSTGARIYKKIIIRIFDGAKIYLSSPKLERGKVATDWTPNPNDKLNKNAYIQSNDDLNDYTKTGIYRCLLNNTAKTVLNLPLEFNDTRASAFILNVEQTTSNGCKQTLTFYLLGKVFEYNRTFYNGNWSQWQIKLNQINCVCFTTENSGANGFAKIMKIKNIKSTTYYNTVIGFDVYQRNKKFPVRCYLKFKNENVENFNIDSFYYYGEDSDIYIINSKDKEWDLYIKKTENNDVVEIKNLTVNDSFTTKNNKLEFYSLNEECLNEELPYDETDTHSAKAVKSDYCLDKEQTDSYYLSLNGGNLNGDLNVNGDISSENIITELSTSSTDEEIPSAKAVYDKCETKLDKLQKTVTTFNLIDYVIDEDGAIWNDDDTLILRTNGDTITFNFTDMLNDIGDYFEWELKSLHGTVFMVDDTHSDEIWNSSVNSMIRIRITKNQGSDSYHITTTDLLNNTIIKDYDKDYSFNLTFLSLNGVTVSFSNKKWYHTVSFIDMIYPIGSIYMSVNDMNPSLFIGGIWEQIEDRFLLACGSTYTNGATGGEATHTLTINEMPKHKHDLSYRTGIIQTGSSGTYYFDVRTSGNWYTNSPSFKESGGGASHNNMPPYLAVYMWKRIG